MLTEAMATMAMVVAMMEVILVTEVAKKSDTIKSKAIP